MQVTTIKHTRALPFLRLVAPVLWGARPPFRFHSTITVLLGAGVGADSDKIPLKMGGDVWEAPLTPVF